MVTNVDVGTINTNFSSDKKKKNQTKCVSDPQVDPDGAELRRAFGFGFFPTNRLTVTVCYTIVSVSLPPVNHSSENEISA